MLVAFGAGILTFVSPCVLPLMPAYICYITGLSLEELKTGDKNSLHYIVLNTLFFIIGFTIVFTLLGASATFFGSIIVSHKDILRWIGGILIIVFGLHIAGVSPIKFLYKEKSLSIKKKPAGFIGSFFVGITFAIAWTPCVGPILSSILIFASTQETIKKGIFLLIAYSLGLGVPLLITSLAINQFFKLFNKIKRYFKIIEIAGGIILIIMGIFIITDKFNLLTQLLGSFGGITFLIVKNKSLMYNL